MKYFRFYDGHVKLERKQYLMVGLYAESRLAARKTMERVLYMSTLDDELPQELDKGLIYEYIDERDLHEGEEPVQIIYGYQPDINGEYSNTHAWEIAY